ncbi:MAG: FliH/SctL family protein [Vampirovibrionales bacterium]
MPPTPAEQASYLAPPPEEQHAYHAPHDTFGDDEEAFLSQLVWTAEAVEAGELPERRQSPRQWRRYEDTLLIESAYQEAEWIRQQAQEQGFQAGYQQGLEQGLAQAQADFRENTDAFWDLFESVQTARAEALASAAPFVTSLALAVARRIMKVEATLDPSLVMAQIEGVLQKMDRTQKQVLIKVHSSEARYVRRHLEQLQEEGLEREFFVQPDDAVEVGSCILESTGGQIDASFSTQLSQLQKLITAPPLPMPSETPSPPLDYATSPHWQALEAQEAQETMADAVYHEDALPDASVLDELYLP